MTCLKLALLGALALGLSAPAFAQTPPPASSSPKGPPASEMSKPPSALSETDMATWKRCKALSKDAMMRDADCVRLSKAHPAPMNKDGMASDTMKDSGTVKK